MTPLDEALWSSAPAQRMERTRWREGPAEREGPAGREGLAEREVGRFCDLAAEGSFKSEGASAQGSPNVPRCAVRQCRGLGPVPLWRTSWGWRGLSSSSPVHCHRAGHRVSRSAWAVTRAKAEGSAL